MRAHGEADPLHPYDHAHASRGRFAKFQLACATSAPARAQLLPAAAASSLIIGGLRSARILRGGAAAW